MAIKRSGKGRRGGGSEGTGDWGKLTPLQEMLLKEAAREISIISNGVSQTVSMGEVVARKMMQVAANGGQHSISNVMHQINTAQRLKQQEIDEEVSVGHRYKACQQHLLDEAREHGRDLDTVLPHPDDIVVEEGIGYQVIGPIDETELSAVKRDCDRLDAAILQAALEARLGALPSTAGRQASKHPVDASALLMIHVINDALPKRFQKSNLQIARELMRYQGVSKRELLKRAHRKWASVGRPKPRGWRLPPLEISVSILERVVPAMITLYPDVKSGKLSEERIAVRLQRMIGPVPLG